MDKEKVNVKTKTANFRVLFVLGIVAIVFFLNYYRCIMLDLSSTPGLILQNKDKENAILLYGTGLCGSCPPGKALLDLENRGKYFIVVPESFSDVDIYNLRDAFMIKGSVMRGNKEIENLLKKIASCKGFPDWQTNINLKVDRNGHIHDISKFR
jgi:hypothetical protein